MSTAEKLQNCYEQSVVLFSTKDATASFAELITARERTAEDLRQFFSEVSDVQMYAFLSLHFLCGFTWDEVALITGAVSGMAVSTRVYKYFKTVLRMPLGVDA